MKRDLCQKHGVREYWTVHPLEHWVVVYLLDDAGFYGKPEMFGVDEATVVRRLEGLMIDWGFMVTPNSTP